MDLKPWKESGYSHAHDNKILPNGYRVNKFAIEEYLGSNKHSKHIYLVKCDCGNKFIGIGSVLKRRSMGCNSCSRKNYSQRIGETLFRKFCENNKTRIETILSLVGLHTILEISKYVGNGQRTVAHIINAFGYGEGKGCPGHKKSIAHRKALSEAKLRYHASKTSEVVRSGAVLIDD